jgi:putative peptide zinc metalloprotease protein
VALPQAADLSGQFIRRGRLLGQVIGNEPATVRVALPESEASDLRRVVRAVSVQLTSAPGSTHGAALVRDSIGAVMQLPSAALSARHGGDVQTDPRDADDLKPLQPVVLLDVSLDARPQAQDGSGRERIGERAWVRFDTGLAPLALQFAQALQRTVLRHFNPQV